MKNALLVFAVAGSLSAFAAAPDGNEWQDNQRLSLGKEAHRAAFSSFSTLEGALKILPEFSDRQVSLDSDTEWKFHWAKDPETSRRETGAFWEPSRDVSGWATIKVPCSWQAMGARGEGNRKEELGSRDVAVTGGWGTPLYTNIRYPFAKDAPGGSKVMAEPPKDFTNYKARNPVGCYRRDFVLPEGWMGGTDKVFLKLDGVDSFYYLWVNGTYVGFSKDSRSPSEYDITKLLKPGNNMVALEVYRYSDGSYMEDQDMFRLSGIFRHTWLVKRPAERIRDFFVTAKPVRDGDFKGEWLVEVKSNGEGGRQIVTSLYTWDGRLVARSDKKMFVVKSPKLWSAEEPNCYKVVLSNGKEFVSTAFGFRTSEIRNGRWYVNGQKIKLKGANRHETHPMYGHYVPRETHEQDVRELKAANCNAVRNSHYPQDDYWYYLCDIHGIYLCDEANVESHGYGYGADSLSHQKSWEKATVDRNAAMFERNKNHPSVVIWSYGNEAGPGENFQAVQKFYAEHDTTRVTHYERDWSVADMTANQYPSVDWMWHKARDAKATKPHYTSEYAHNMVNAMGNLKDYQDAIESSDVVLGATIWDWVDQGLYAEKKASGEGEERPVRIIAYGGDFGDKPNDGQFVMNGCVLSDRTREPGFYEVQHVFQNWSARYDKETAKIILRNKNYFIDATGIDCRWTVYREGRQVASGIFPLDVFRKGLLGPQQEKSVPIPPIVNELRGKGGEVSLRVKFLKGKDEVAIDQIDFPRLVPAEGLATCKEAPEMTEDEKSYAFKAAGVEYAFCKKTGMPYSIKTGKISKTEWLKEMAKPDLFRTPSSNEVGPGQKWMAAGLHDMECAGVEFSDFTNAVDGVAFSVVSRWKGKRNVRLDNFGHCNTTMADQGAVGGDNALVIAARWTVRGDGALVCQSEFKWDGKPVEVARIGYRFVFGMDNLLVEYFGAGPEENYRDRMSGAFLGRYHASSGEFYFPYARNEDCGNHQGTRSVSFDAGWDHLSFTTCADPFAFEVNPYSPVELIRYNHPPELPQIEKTEFGVYAETRGLGGASCGPDVLPRDRVKTDRAYKLAFVIRPEKAEGAVSVPPAKLPQVKMQSVAVLTKVVACTSREPGEGEPEHVFDGDARSIWHTQYGTTMGMFPHALAVDLGRDVMAKGVRFLGRNDGSTNGRVKGYNFEVSCDGEKWSRMLEGELKDSGDWQTFEFKSPVKMRYWRFIATSGHYKTDFATMAEIEVIVK